VTVVALLLLAALVGSLALLAYTLTGSRRARGGSVRSNLNELKSEGYLVLHDVAFGAEGDVDHLVIGSDKVVVVASPIALDLQAKLVQDELGCPVTPVVAGAQAVDAIRSAPGGEPVDMQRVYALVGAR